jgi:hypothetical protein
MTDFLMKVIPEPSPGSASILVFEKRGRHSMMTGQGEDNYLCGLCKNVICETLLKGTVIQNIVFKCPNCDSFNIIK